MLLVFLEPNEPKTNQKRKQKTLAAFIHADRSRSYLFVAELRARLLSRLPSSDQPLTIAPNNDEFWRKTDRVK